MYVSLEEGKTDWLPERVFLLRDGSNVVVHLKECVVVQHTLEDTLSDVRMDERRDAYHWDTGRR